MHPSHDTPDLYVHFGGVQQTVVEFFVQLLFSGGVAANKSYQRDGARSGVHSLEPKLEILVLGWRVGKCLEGVIGAGQRNPGSAWSFWGCGLRC
jgi:hypothetical protein